jgi:hypothetical protein
MPGMSARNATGISAMAVFCCCLMCCAIPGVVALIVLNQEFNDWIVVDAVVIGTTFCSSGSSSSSNRGSESTYSVTYNFTTVEGEQITAETDYCSSPVPDIGETDQITYDPDDPSSIIERDILDIGFIAAKAGAGVGWTCVVIGLCVAAFMFSRPKPNDNNQTTTYQPYAQPNGPAGDYGNSNNPPASVPYSQPNGPAGDFGNSLGGQEHPSATATPVTYNASGKPVGYNSPSQPAQVYGGNPQPVNSGPATYYK